MSTPSISLPPDQPRSAVRQAEQPPAAVGAARGTRSVAAARTLPLPRPELALLLVLAAALNLWALSRNGFANEYYGAAVRAMTESWHAFLYGSFDAAGVMTVDKPPLALWVQALSVRAFGFSSWSVLMPQALMGMASVALAYDLTRRRFGRAAGFAAGLVLALTPITVAISRHNNPDALLALCATAALWFVLRGLEDGRTRWLVLSGVMIGLGFETKMAAALLVVPALAAAWLWVAPRGRVAAVRQLLAGGAAMAAVALAWPVLVWLTPADDRPWVSGTADNSIWSLIFGYNGLGRLFGQDGGPGGGAGGPGGAGAGGVFGGEPGALRLLNVSMGGQVGWLLGFAIVAGVLLLAATRLRRNDARTGWLIAAGGSFLTIAVAFSTAEGIFHPYYTSQLAPFTAVLVGAGVAELARGGRLARIAAPAAIAAGVIVELIVLDDNPDSLGWLPPVLAAAGVIAAIALAGGVVGGRARGIVVGAVLGLLLLAPATWAVQTIGHTTNGTFPAGGPVASGMGGGFGGPMGRGRDGGDGGGQAGGPPAGALTPPAGAVPGSGAGGFAPPGGGGAGGNGFGGGGFGGDTGSLTEAVAYAEANGGGTLAVASQSGAAGQVISSGADVAALGGFSGRESQVSLAWLADAVERGRIRWALTDGAGGMGFDGRVGARDIMAVVEEVGTPVDEVSGLYDLQGLAEELRERIT
jgi:4-amino-4-deoxy-L-arabinose transferase-like glycosyltransferase